MSKDESVAHGLVLQFEDGEDVSLNFLMHKPQHNLNGNFHEQLGLELTA